MSSQPLETQSYLPSFQRVSDLNPWAHASGMGEYLTPLNVNEARPLGAYLYSELPKEEAAVAELSTY